MSLAEEKVFLPPKKLVVQPPSAPISPHLPLTDKTLHGSSGSTVNREVGEVGESTWREGNDQVQGASGHLSDGSVYSQLETRLETQIGDLEAYP